MDLLEILNNDNESFIDTGSKNVDGHFLYKNLNLCQGHEYIIMLL